MLLIPYGKVFLYAEYDINDLLEYVGMIFYLNILASFLYGFSYYLV